MFKSSCRSIVLPAPIQLGKPVLPFPNHDLSSGQSGRALFMEARGFSLMSSLQKPEGASRSNRSRYDRTPRTARRPQKTLDPLGPQGLGQPDRSDVILKRKQGRGRLSRSRGYHPSSKSCSYQCNNVGANTIDRPLYVKVLAERFAAHTTKLGLLLFSRTFWPAIFRPTAGNVIL